MDICLVRVGVDSSKEFGEWNSPIDMETGDFVYIPIPERLDVIQRKGLETPYATITPILESFFERYPIGPKELSRFRARLEGRIMHLDPDFEHLTYGDRMLTPGKSGPVSKGRGISLSRANAGDLLIFYAGLRSVHPPYGLQYGLIGILEISEKLNVDSVPEERWMENAHTRRKPVALHQDFIFRGNPSSSGRLSKFIPIGAFENGAYRVRNEIHEAWGGIAVKDRYIQRGSPFRIKNARKFLSWLSKQNIKPIHVNNPYFLSGSRFFR